MKSKTIKLENWHFYFMQLFLLPLIFVNYLFAHPTAHHNCLASVFQSDNLQAHARLYKRAGGIQFGYNGINNPEFWFQLPGSQLCKIGKGKKQSPIDLNGASLLKVGDDEDIPNFKFTSYRNVPFLNIGNTLEVSLQNQTRSFSTLTFKNSPKTVFVLQQFHFHDPSEHTFDGHALPLEAHFVYKSASGKLAVFALLFQFSTKLEQNSLFNQLVQQDFPMTKGDKVVLPTLNLKYLDTLLRDRKIRQKGFYRYEGSLTTPPCTEGIQFTILNNAFQITSPLLAAFWAAMPRNARYTQPATNRNSDLSKNRASRSDVGKSFQ